MALFGLIKSKDDLRRDEIELARAETLAADEMIGKFKEMQELRSDAFFDGLSVTGHPAVHPSKLVQRQGLKVFVEMPVQDDMVNFARANLLLSIIAPGFEYVAFDAAEGRDVEAADFQEANMLHCRGTSAQMILDQCGAITDGFAVSEAIYDKLNAGGDWAGKRFYKMIVGKGPKNIGFATNDYNDIEENGVMQLNYSASGGSYKSVPLEDVIYHVHWPTDNSPYGSSLLISAYRPYIFKQVVWQSMGRFFEHYGVPWPSVTVTEDKFFALQSDSSALSKLRTFLKDGIKRGYSIRPDTMGLGQNQPDSIGVRTTAYVEAMTTANRAIGRSLWNPALMGEDTEHSTKAATEVQTVTQFERFLKYEAANVMESWNRQAIKRSHLLNYGSNVGCPTMRILPYSRDNMLIQAQIMDIMAKWGVVFDTETVHERFGTIGELDGQPTVGASQPSSLPPGAPLELIEDEKAELKRFTQDVFDLLERNRDGKKMPINRLLYSFPGNGNGDSLEASTDAGDKIESVVDFEATNQQEDIAQDLWGTYAGIELQEMADEVEDQAGKSSRDR